MKILYLILMASSIVMSSHVVLAQSQSQLGSSFNCTRPSSSAAEMVCRDPSLRRIDLEQIQAYYTLRHALPSEVGEFRQQYISIIRRIEAECSLSILQNQEETKNCIFIHLSNMRDSWNNRILYTNNQAAIDEQRIDLSRKIQLQTILQSRGYISPAAGIDGIFGSGARGAITQFQRENGIAVTGLMGRETAERLLSSSQVYSRQAMPAQLDQSPRQPSSIQSNQNNEDKNIIWVVIFLIIIIIYITYRIVLEKIRSRCPRCGAKNTFKIVDSFDEPKSTYTKSVRDSNGNYSTIAYEVGVTHETRCCASCRHQGTILRRYDRRLG